MTPTISERPAMRFIGIETAFIHGLSPRTNAPEVIGNLWGTFGARHDEFPEQFDDACYGIIYGLPEDQRSDPHELQYIAGVMVDAETPVPDGMVDHDVPAAKWAQVTHHGPIRTICETVGKLYREWLPDSEFEHAEIADLERYDDRFDPHSDDSIMDYAITVK